VFARNRPSSAAVQAVALLSPRAGAFAVGADEIRTNVEAMRAAQVRLRDLAAYFSDGLDTMAAELSNKQCSKTFVIADLASVSLDVTALTVQPKGASDGRQESPDAGNEPVAPAAAAQAGEHAHVEA
jgi:hypothetical protein